MACHSEHKILYATPLSVARCFIIEEIYDQGYVHTRISDFP